MGCVAVGSGDDDDDDDDDDGNKGNLPFTLSGILGSHGFCGGTQL